MKEIKLKAIHSNKHHAGINLKSGKADTQYGNKLRSGNEDLIVKVQIPIGPFSGDEAALVYNEDRSVQGFFKITDDLLVEMDGLPKKYFIGRMAKDGLCLTEEFPRNPSW